MALGAWPVSSGVRQQSRAAACVRPLFQSKAVSSLDPKALVLSMAALPSTGASAEEFTRDGATRLIGSVGAIAVEDGLMSVGVVSLLASDVCWMSGSRLLRRSARLPCRARVWERPVS